MAKKLAIITGASAPIGLAISKKLLSENYFVVGQYYTEDRHLKVLAETFPDLLVLCQQDLSDANKAKTFIEGVSNKYGDIDVLINTIGPMISKDLDQLSPKEWDEQIHFNLSLGFYLAYYAKPILVKKKGHLIYFAYAGVEHLSARIESSAYCAAKAGLVILIKSLAQMLAKSGVRVNAISPGLIEEGLPQDPHRKKIVQEIPLGRPGTPSEIADVLW